MISLCVRSRDDSDAGVKLFGKALTADTGRSTCQPYDGIVCAAVLDKILVHIPSDTYQISVEHQLIGR